jgi:hypothetical protein
MTHKFEYHFDGHGVMPDSHRVHETNGETLEDALLAFEDYLRGCGYVFDIDEHVRIVYEGEE